MTTNIVDKGGKIFKTGRLQVIFWGPGWDSADQNPRKVDVIAAFDRLCNGPFFTHLLQYRKIRPPEFLDPITNTITVQTTTISKAQVEQCIEDSIQFLAAPDFHNDPNVFYLVMLPNGIDTVDGTFHWRFTWNSANGYYAVSPGTVATGGTGGALGLYTVRYLKTILGILTAPDNGFTTAGFVYDTHTVRANPAFDEITDHTSLTGVTDGGYQAPAYESNEMSAIIVPDTSPLVLPQADAGADTFGVKKLYFDDTSKTAENWVLTSLTGDSRLRVDGSVTNLGSGVWEGHVTTSDNPASFRINVNTTNPNAMDPATQSILGTHWDQMAIKEYMVDARDFKNVEMTIYWKVTSWSSSDEMSIYARGGRHTDGWPAACLGPCYKGQIQKPGNSRWAKEYHHFSGSDGYVFTAGHNTSTLSDRTNVWTGQKTVLFNKTVNGKQVVRGEIWIDTAGDSNPAAQNWQMVNWFEDSGSFGQPSNTGYISNCHAISQQMFNWGGPTAVFRIDDVVVQVKKASVRNILPEGSTAPPGPTPCPTGQHFDTALGRCVDDTNAPPPPPSDTAVPYIKFYNSGGATNSNPFQSIGGAISNVEIAPDSFNNLWDTLSVADQRTGKKSTRVLYVKNTDATVGLPDTKTYFGVTDNFTSMSLGAVPKNTTESGVITEVEEKVVYYALPTTTATLDTIAAQAMNNTITKVAIHFTDATNQAIGKKITRWTVNVRKVGSPTGTLSAKLLSSTNTVKMTFTTTFNVATALTTTVSTDYKALIFEKLDNTTIVIASGDRLDLEYTTGTSTNYIEVAIKKTVQSSGIELSTWNGTAWSVVAGDASSLGLAAVDPGATATRVTIPGRAIDRGGIVNSAMRVVLIYWGNNTGQQAQLDAAFRAVLLGPGYTNIRQYAGLQPPVWGGSFVNTTTSIPSQSAGTTLNQILTVVKDTISRNPTIRPTSTNLGNNVTGNKFCYYVIPPPMLLNNENIGDGWTTWTNDSTYGEIVYGQIHNRTDQPSLGQLGGNMCRLTHEVIHAIVDKEFPRGIVVPSNFAGNTSGYDFLQHICFNDPSLAGNLGFGAWCNSVSGTLMGQYFSNRDNKCTVPLVNYDPNNPTGGGGGSVVSAIAGKLESGGPSAVGGGTGQVIYRGGPFFATSKVHLIFWGNAWATQSNPSQAQIISGAQNICTGTYFTGLSQYGGITKTVYNGSINSTSTPVDSGTALINDLVRLINAKLVPDPATNPGTFYMYVYPSSFHGLDGGQATAYHNWFTLTAGVNVAYGATETETIDDATIGISHEIVEAVTNPFYSDTVEGYVSNTHLQIPSPEHDEICDACDFPEAIQNVNGVMVDRYYSNKDATCIAPTTDQSTDATSLFTMILDLSLSVAGQVVRMDNNRTKMAEHIWGSRTPIYNQKIAKVDVFLRKTGAPTGNLKCSIINQPRPLNEGTGFTGLLEEGKYNEVFVFDPLFNVSTLTTSAFTKVTFTKLVTDPYEPSMGDAIMFEYTGGNATNYIEFALAGNAIILADSNVGMNLEAFSTSASLWDDYKPDGITGCDLSLIAYINSGYCFGSGNPGTGGNVGVVFKQPTTYETGLLIGQLNPSDYKSIILQRDIPANSPNDEDAAIELVVAAGGSGVVDPGGGPGNPPPTCPAGQHVDTTTNLCVPNSPPVGGGNTTIYPATGQVTQAVDSGATTRHFASDGSSPTTEREVNNCPYENYEMTAYMNIPSDEATFKMWGPTHSDSNRAWYLTVVSSNGDTHFGWEDPHPTTNKDCAQGANIGNVGSKVIGIKGVIWKLASGSGAHVELWTDTTGQWIKRLSADNPCGKVYSKASGQQVLFRIDARPVTFQSATVAEIKPNPSATSVNAFAFDDAQVTTNLSPTTTAGTNALQSESNEEDNDVS